MSKTQLNSLLTQIKSRGSFDESDILALRKVIWDDGAISLTEADALFGINHLGHKPKSWPPLFIEAVSSFLVNQTMPQGYINQANAAWLMTRIDHDGIVETHTELELLLSVLKKAHNVTDELEMYALEQVKQAALGGKGYLGRGHALEPGVIGEPEVDVLKRVLYSCSSEGGIGISQLEAEALFDLNDACANAENHESWTRLFVGGIANHLMMLAAWEEPTAQEALRLDNWLETPSKGFVVPSLKGIGDAFKTLFAEPEIKFTNMNTGAVLNAERVTAGEAFWLIERLNRDGILHKNERALLSFLKAESPEIHESLSPYLRTA